MIKPEPLVRSILPARLEAWAADKYRAFFVDLEKVTDIMAQRLPDDAVCLDIGGGDGTVLNSLMQKRPDIRVTMIDISPTIGRLIAPEIIGRVVRHPSTSIDQHLEHLDTPYDAAIVSDVLHHVPREIHGDFMLSIAQTLRPGATLLVKDVQPGHPVATLGYLADKYISGDKGVRLLSMDEAKALLALTGFVGSKEADLLAVDAPNYLLVAKLPLH